MHLTHLSSLTVQEWRPDLVGLMQSTLQSACQAAGKAEPRAPTYDDVASLAWAVCVIRVKGGDGDPHR